MKDIALVTYTNDNCRDIWLPYFDSLNTLFPSIKGYVFNNSDNFEFQNQKLLIYEEELNYCSEFSRLLHMIEEDYIIYMQEDFILYDKVAIDKIEEYKTILDNSSLSFIRLLKCGSVSNIQYINDLFYITDPGKNHNSIDSFSMQPTIWKKTDLIRIYENTMNHKFGENWNFIHSMNMLKINGFYCYNGENKRGLNHYDSSIFPYIATAIVKGRWNTSEYSTELEQIFDKYKIDKNIRGCR